MSLTTEDIDRIAERVVEKLHQKNPPTLTLEEFAKKLGVAEITVRRMHKAGQIRKIPGIKRLIFPATELTRLLNHGN